MGVMGVKKNFVAVGEGGELDTFIPLNTSLGRTELSKRLICIIKSKAANSGCGTTALFRR